MGSHKEHGVTFGALSIALIAMAIILVMAFIKIHISNQIYYESRQAHLLEQEVAALKEEHTILQMRVEKLKFKSQITDTIFTMDETVEENTETDMHAKEENQ